MKIAVYTAIFGAKDILKDPCRYSESSEIDYFCFTDDADLKSETYNIFKKKAHFQDITKCARFFKINFPKELSNYDYLIWHDGNLQINHQKIYELVELLGKNDLATFKHPHRDNIYLEGLACIRREKDDPCLIFKQIFNYYKSGIIKSKKLFETSILVRKNRQSELYDIWWNEVLMYSKRDQLSLPYALFKSNTCVSIIPGHREVNEYAKFHGHVNSGYLFDYKRIKKSNYLQRIFAIIGIKFLILIQRF
ncbi:DUF616 domain-containing protein [Cyclobacteriaceae bacterium YHN15]|nr:DUF616 domain-containing protein [Cyclobacteriaceae bacterium YHN15]